MKEDEILETVEIFLDGERHYDTIGLNKYLAIQGLLDLYCKEKARADKLEKDYTEMLTKIYELEVKIDNTLMEKIYK